MNRVMKWCRKNNQLELVNPREQQSQKLAELGNQLRLKRQEQGLSLEEVAAKTLIRRQLLQAIETGELNELPEPIYIRGFIRQYADVLGLDGSELSNSFPARDHRPNIKPVWTRLPAVQLRSTHLYLLYIVVIVCAVNTLSNTLSHSNLQISQSQIQEQPLPTSAVKPDTLSQPSDKIKPVSDTPSTANKTNKPVQINVTLKADSWIRVVADGKKQFEGLLPEGTQRTWVAQEQLTVRVGNAGGVLVTFNEEEAKQLGDLGEVQEVTFGANPRS